MRAIVRLGSDRRVLRVSSLSVSRALEDAVSQASVDTFEQRRSALAEPFEIDIEGWPFGGPLIRRFTGVPEQYPGTPERGYQAAGRGKSVNLGLVDSRGTEIFRHTTAGRIAATLAERVGVTVSGSVDDAVSRYKLRRATNYQRAIQELADAHGFVLTDLRDGNALLYKLPDPLTPVETWVLGRPPVLDVELDPSIDQWRDSVELRGERSLVTSDVANVVAGQFGVDIVVGNTRASRVVLPKSAANSSGQAAMVVAQEVRKRLARSFSVRVSLMGTSRNVGDIVRLRAREIPEIPLVIASLAWTVSPTQSGVEAILRLPATYGSGTVIAPTEIARATA